MLEYCDTHDGPPVEPEKPSDDDQGLTWVAKAGAVVIAVFLVVLMVASDNDQQKAHEARMEGEADQAAQHNTAPTEYTKASLRRAVDGKTKEQIRDMFGSPDNVDDPSNSWYYWHLPVYDEAAGTKVNNTKIMFDGFTASDTEVVEVSFP
jgi:hypothetical protein